MRRFLKVTALAAALALTGAPAAWACGKISESEPAASPPGEEMGSPADAPLAFAAGGGGLLVLGGATLLVLRKGGMA